MGQAGHLDILKNKALFRVLSMKEIAALYASGVVGDYKAGEIIYLQNDSCTSFDIILTGNISIQHIDNNGRILTIVHLGVGESFGGNLVFAQDSFYPMTVKANDDCRLLHLSKELIIEQCQTNEDFLIEFIRSLSHKTMVVADKFTTLTMKDIRGKLINYLLSEYARQKTSQIKLKLNRQELAEMLGVSRPALSRELSKMKADGLIDYSRNIIIIQDPKILK